MKEDIKSNKMTGPEIFYAGPMLERSPLDWEKFNEKLPGFTVPINTEEDVDTIIQKLQENKASLIKTFNKFDLEIYKYFVKEAKRINLPITHDPGYPLYNSIPMDLAIDLGIKCIEHGKAPWPSVLKNELQKEHDKLLNSKKNSEKTQTFAMKIISLGIDSISIEKLHKLANKMVQNNVYICPTLIIFKDKSEEKDNKNIKIIEAVYKVASFFIKELIKRKVKIIVGIDSCQPNTFQEMKILKSIGLSEKEIIKGATKYPADWLNIYDKYGSIETDKKANILIVNDNPLEAIENLEKTHIVFKDGNIV